MKKFYIMFVLVFCFFSFIANATASDQKITGEEANQILTEHGLTAIFDESREYTLLSENWVFDTLTGNPFCGNEPYTVRLTAEDAKKGINHARLSEKTIRDRIPNAALGILYIQESRRQWGPFEIVSPNAHINFFLTRNKEICYFNPLNPKKILVLTKR